MYLIIAGTRTFNDYELLKQKLDKILANVIEDIVVISGECRGADKLGERYAKEKGYELLSFPYPTEHGKAGGPMRNEVMAKIATHCVVFWDGESSGTASMIAKARSHGVITRVVRYK